MLKNVQKFIKTYWRDCVGLTAIIGVTLVLLSIRYISYFATM